MFEPKKYTEVFNELFNPKNEKIACFEDAEALCLATDRQAQITDIDDVVGEAIETLIRVWNKIDDEEKIPIDKREPIKLFIDSGGGSLTATLSIIDAIALSKTPVWTICTGTAYSGGFFIFIAGHRRLAYPHASFLFHEGATGSFGDAGKFRNFADFYDKQLTQIKDIVLHYTDISEELYQKHIKDDWWFTVSEAIYHNICDEELKEFV